jgi:GR25 family glycosyltransferase involved in LPS biosynthesis
MLKYKILIINLKKRDDRKKNMIKLFNKYEIKNYIFYEAFDGKKIELNLEIKNLFEGNDVFNRKCVIGCALSHYNIWLNLIMDEENDYYLIFEDDIRLSQNFKKYLEKSKEYINNNDIDFLFLGYTSFSNDNIDRTNEELDYIIEDLDRNKYLGGFFSYIITKNGAKKMIDYINRNGIKHGIDYLIKINENLNLKVINPLIVFTDWVKDVNDNIDSNIQKDYENFNFQEIYDYNNYYFIKGKDIKDNDLQFINSRNINILLNESNKNENSQGFNTLGVLKRKNEESLFVDSIYFSKEDYTFVKINQIKKIRIMGNYWTNSEDLCKEFNVMSQGNCKWNDIKITHEDNDIDYYVIINKPCDNTYYNSFKTIVFQMEPWVDDENLNWGIKTWREWSIPDENKFMEIRGRKTKCYNNCYWQLELTYNELKNMIIKKNENETVSTICSSKYFDKGHIKRIDFLKFLEEKGNILLDIYNHDNIHNFKNYRKPLHPYINKSLGLIPYKYYFMVENNFENDFITEKLWEPIISECLCFYYGASNVSDYINPLAYVQLDLDNFEESYNIINSAIKNDLWSDRIEIIREEKYKILNYYNFYPTVERIINKDIWKNELKILNESIKIYFIKRNEKINCKTEILIKILKEFNFKINIFDYSIDKNNLIIENISNHENDKKIIYDHQIKYFNIFNNKIIESLELIILYEKLLEDNENKNFLIIDENLELNTSLNNLFNHIKYLPNDYDICNLSKMKSICPLIISQYNSFYYNIKKYNFECTFPYFISKKGIEKILIYINNNINIEYERIISHCNINIESFKFYSIQTEHQIFV